LIHPNGVTAAMVGLRPPAILDSAAIGASLPAPASNRPGARLD
jgi:hypothetical protein